MAQTGPTMPANSCHVPYCFADAYWCRRKGLIDQTEYIKRLVAHFGGVRHIDPEPLNENDTGICPSALYDHVASAVREASVLKEYRPVRDVKSYEKLFLDCVENRREDVITNLARLHAKKLDTDPTQPIALLAASYGHVEILLHCIKNGAIFDRHLAHEMMAGEEKNKEVGKLVKVLYPKIEPSLQPRFDPDGDFTEEQMEESFEDIEW